MKIDHASNYNDMCQKAANLIAAQILLKPRCVLGLATGSTPEGVYAALVDKYKRGELDFSAITSYNLDEYRGLPKDDLQSYYYYMHSHLFHQVNARAERIHLPEANPSDMEKECENYDARIEADGGIDLQLLGIGNNGHIGFNEPGSVFVKGTHCVDLDEGTIQANARFFADPKDVPRQAITMGMKSIMCAKKIVLVANGEAKKAILDQAMNGPVTPMVPASILQLHPDVTVFWSAI